MRNKKVISSLVLMIVLLVAFVILGFKNITLNNIEKLKGDIVSYPSSNGFKISCDSTSLSVGGSTSCTLTGYCEGGASGVQGALSTSGGISLSNISLASGWSKAGSGPATEMMAYYTGAGEVSGAQFIVSTFTVTATAEGNATVTLGKIEHTSSAKISNANDTSIPVSDAFTSFTIGSSQPVLSGEGRLSSLTVTNTSFTFNSDTYTYNNINVDNSISSVDISATAMDPNRQGISGTGTHNLNVGNNEIKVIVTAQNGTPTTYTLNINRGQSADNTLKSLSITNTTIADEFKNSVTSYTKTITDATVNTITIRAEANSSSATLLYNNTTYTDSFQANRSISNGNNEFTIKVTAQNGSSKTFTINIIKDTSGKSSDSSLKSLKITNTNIESSFSKTKLDYNATVANSVSSVKITATPNHNKATVSASSVGTKSLKVGDNLFRIVVTAENGGSTTYTVRITRKSQQESSGGGSSSGGNGNSSSNGGSSSNGSSSSSSSSSSKSNTAGTVAAKDNNSLLKNLTINDKELMLSDSVYKYNFSVLNNVTKLNIVATAKSDKSKVVVDKPDKLTVGKNNVTIKVTAEDGSETTYKIVVTRKDEDEELSSDSQLASLSIENYDIDFNADTYDYELKIKNENKLKISYVASGINTNVIIKNNEKLKNNSIITVVVTAEDGVSTSEYNIKVKKSIAPVVIISLLIMLLLAGLAAFYFLFLKKKLQNRSKEIPVGTTDTIDNTNDFEEVDTIEEPTLVEPATQPTEEAPQDIPNPQQEAINNLGNEQGAQPTEQNTQETSNN